MNKYVSNISVINNGIDLEEFEIYNSVPISRLTGEPVLVTVGSVTERKGQHNVIKALPLILKRYPKLRYHCIGLPVITKDLMVLAGKLEVSHAVTFHGVMERSQLFGALKSADIFIMLSD